MTDEAWIDTVRLARDFGTVSELFPRFIDDLRDLPYPLFHAIRQAEVFLGFEELPDDERPPKRIWLDGEQLKEWFEEVKRKRQEEASGERKSIDGPVSQNEAAKGLIVG